MISWMVPPARGLGNVDDPEWVPPPSLGDTQCNAAFVSMILTREWKWGFCNSADDQKEGLEKNSYPFPQALIPLEVRKSRMATNLLGTRLTTMWKCGPLVQHATIEAGATDAKIGYTKKEEMEESCPFWIRCRVPHARQPRRLESPVDFTISNLGRKMNESSGRLPHHLGLSG